MKKTTNKRKKPNVEQRLVNFMETHNVTKKSKEEDEDLTFFYSILPTVTFLTFLTKNFVFECK